MAFPWEENEKIMNLIQILGIDIALEFDQVNIQEEGNEDSIDQMLPGSSTSLSNQICGDIELNEETKTTENDELLTKSRLEH